MIETVICQGRELTASDLLWLRSWILKHIGWSRSRLAKELCRNWNWRSLSGQIKNFAARSFLLKLEQRGLVTLPPVRVAMRRATWSNSRVETAFELETKAPIPIASSLVEIKPLSLVIPQSRSFLDRCFTHYLIKHHYLGFNGTVGENLKYLVRDCLGRDLACLLFGSAAWKTAPRDAFIGWSDDMRRRNVNFLTNNTRFLILPWVRVPHLVSHILGMVTRRQPPAHHGLHQTKTWTS